MTPAQEYASWRRTLYTGCMVYVPHLFGSPLSYATIGFQPDTLPLPEREINKTSGKWIASMDGSVARFSNRVGDYVRHRPRYPAALVDALRADYGLRPTWQLADVGAGTGLLTQLLLTAGCAVYAVEPNQEMRRAAEYALGGHPGFHSVAGTAEATTLAHQSIDLITAGQAFHWFDVEGARREFQRILRPQGLVALVWNRRHSHGTPFLEGYEALLREFGIDYLQVDHTHTVDERRFAQFFGQGGYRVLSFPNRQLLDFEGVRGRLVSTSYMPAPDHPRFGAMLAGLRDLFDRCADAGRVTMAYDTEIYIGSPG